MRPAQQRMAPLALSQPARFMAQGPKASATVVSDELLEKLSTLSTQSLIDGLWVMGWPTAFIEGARPLKPGQKCAGAARPSRVHARLRRRRE